MTSWCKTVLEQAPLLFYMQVNRSWPLKNIFHFFPNLFWSNWDFWILTRLKQEIKLIGSLCTPLTIENPWRIVQPFLHLSLKEPPSLHSVQNWNTNIQEVTHSPSAPQWKSLAFLIWVSQVAELMLLTPAERGSSLLSTDNNLYLINWKFNK